MAMEITNALRTLALSAFHKKGVEGFEEYYNERTGQSKTVFINPTLGIVVKELTSQFGAASGEYLGCVKFEDENKTYHVRACEYEVFDDVVIQEYVGGEYHFCDHGSWCPHAEVLENATGLDDLHSGNWKICGDEIVIFDFDIFY